MEKRVVLILLMMFLTGCSSNVRFIKTDESYVPASKSKEAPIVFRAGMILRPHRVIGVIEAQLGRKARRPQLDHLLIKKAREIGADGVMSVKYDVDRDVYLEEHHAVIGRGPWRRHVIGTHPRVDVQKTATGIAVVFK